jgi:hypothetical protein
MYNKISIPLPSHMKNVGTSNNNNNNNILKKNKLKYIKEQNTY